MNKASVAEAADGTFPFKRNNDFGNTEIDPSILPSFSEGGIFIDTTILELTSFF